MIRLYAPKKGLRKSIYSLSAILFTYYLVVSSHFIVSGLRNRSETGFADYCLHFPAGRGQ